MKKTLLVLIFLAIGASAWGPETKKFICEESVIRSWGATYAAECLRDMNLSSQLDIFDSDPLLKDYGPSLSTVINPALIPEEVFNDTENHHDYSDCPLVPGQDYSYLCGDKNENPATYSAEVWFSKAMNSTSMCERIQKFCVAANYFSDGYFPPNRIKAESANGCEKALSDGVDYNIIKMKDSWQVRGVCRFEYARTFVGQNRTFRYKQAFVLTNNGIESIISDLAEKGSDIMDKPYISTTTTSVVTTSTTTETSVRAETTLPVVDDKSGAGVLLFGVFLVILIPLGYLLLNRRKRG